MKGLAGISSRTLWVIAALSAVLTAVLSVKLFAINEALKPYGIVCYEFAWSAERAMRMYSAWGEAGREAARSSLRYDVPYLLVYPFLFSSLTLLAARAASGWLAALGTWLAVAPFVAALLDALEDLALWLALDRFPQPPESLLRLAALAAGMKFLLLGASGLYALGMGLRRLKG
ncbi:hypothetical protein [Archangium sp.]|uniref:hypothetical protein n=1 Tax=Archangium sp. TaxID=1872627 RepID=UPI0038998C3B